MKIKADYANAPQWKNLTIKSRLPEQLKCLDELAHNMWWAWTYEARNLSRVLTKTSMRRSVTTLFSCWIVWVTTARRLLLTTRPS